MKRAIYTVLTILILGLSLAACNSALDPSGNENPTAPKRILAAFTFSTLTPVVGEIVELRDASQGEVFSYLWILPGGFPRESEDPSVQVTWAEAGSLEVSLTVCNKSRSLCDTWREEVVVSEAP